MKILTPIILLVLAGGISTHFTLLGSASEQDNLNVLLISIDTIRPDRISCYSPKYLKTPHIDALAKKGVLFEKAIAHNPLTLPSHVNILVGTTPLHHGVHENSLFILTEDFHTLAEYLKGKGYSTGAFIAAFSLDSRFGLSQGFDVYDESYPSKAPSAFTTYQERNAGKVIQSALDWLEKQNSVWFSFIHIWDPHAPYLPPEPFNVKFKNDPYSGEVAYVDSELRKLFDYLESNNLMENTLVVLTGDHGEALGDHGETSHGYFAYNCTLWVPLIIVGPGIKAAHVDDYVSHIDIFPTICDVLGTEKPDYLQGISLLPLMKGKKIRKRAIYFESMYAYYNRGWAPLQGFIEENKKFIDSPLPEFYNLENDFDEQNNLIQNIDLEEQKKKMRNIIDRLSSLQKMQSPRKVDSDTIKKLKSLGYISSRTTPFKKMYGPEDDLKILLPFQQKHDACVNFYENGRVAEAVKLLNDIIQERKDFTHAYRFLSKIYQFQGLGEEALAVIDNGYKNNPEDYGIISSYGLLLVGERKPDKGIEFLQKALEIIDYDPEVWTYLGIAYSQKGELQKALESHEKALSLDDTDALIYNNLGLIHFTLFNQTKNIQDHTRALEYYKKAITLDPGLASAYNGLGGVFKVIGQIDNAISMWEKTLELDPDYDFPIYNLGVAHFEKGNKAQALKYFERYLLLKDRTLSHEERQKIIEFIRRCKD
ncbi:MAG: sulfatase-like hydrolase/transferase [Candidatus Aminicenantes bacterium]